MAKGRGVYVDKKSIDRVRKRFEKIILASEDFHDELLQEAKATRDEAKMRFSGAPKSELIRRGEYEAGMESSIRYRTLKRQGKESAYEVSFGSKRHKVMAFIEFGTRSRRINLRDVRKVLGADGDAFALRLKGGDNPNNFTNLDAKPYFFISVINQKKKTLERMRKRFQKALK